MIHLVKSEIFPTTLRQMSMGSCSVAMRIGSVLAPYSRELVIIDELLYDKMKPTSIEIY